MTECPATSITEADVLVVGAGPTGLVAAIALRLQGVEHVRIVDALESPSLLAKATLMQPRSLELLEQMGGTALSEILDHARPATNLEIHDYDRGEPLVKTTFSLQNCEDKEHSSGKATILNEQWHTEQVLSRRLSELGITVERGKRVKSYNDVGTLVEVILELEGEPGGRVTPALETITARYVVGCDGAHSPTRHHLGVNFKGKKFPRSYALIHAFVDDMPLDNHTIRIDVGRNGWGAISPVPDGSWLCIFDLRNDDKSQCCLDYPSLDDLGRLLSSRGIHANEIHSSLWCTYFDVHSRQAERYAVGRMFLCGDAVHIHSPLGGQGMNMGLQDAHNLAWKLALVLNGDADESLLDSYHAERYYVDRDVRCFVNIIHSSLSMREVVFFRNTAMKAVSRVQFLVKDALLHRLGQTAYTYRCSNLSVESWGCISNPQYVLLCLSQNLLRFVTIRVKAGDRVPDLELNLTDVSRNIEGDGNTTKNMRLHQWAAAAGTGFKAVIFQGLPSHVLSIDKDDPCAFAMDLLGASCGLISGAAVLPVDTDVYNIFGVRGQCLMLIRPDGYVGLRLEPLSVDMTLSYLAEAVKANTVDAQSAQISPAPIPRFIRPTVLCSTGFMAYDVVWRGVPSPCGIGASLFLLVSWIFVELKGGWLTGGRFTRMYEIRIHCIFWLLMYIYTFTNTAL